MVIVIGRIRAREGSVEVVEEAARTVIAHTRQEDGVVEYEFFQDPADPRSFTIVEVWSDADTFASHTGTQALADFRAAVYPVLDERDVKVFDAEQRVSADLETLIEANRQTRKEAHAPAP